LCLLGFFPFVDAATHALNALKQRVAVAFPTKAATQWTVIASVITVAIPANLLAEWALLIFMVGCITVQAQQALEVGIAHLCTRETDRSIILGGLCVRHHLI
jgi:hypothetical protein